MAKFIGALRTKYVKILLLVFLSGLNAIQLDAQRTFIVSPLVEQNLESKTFTVYNLPVIIKHVDSTFISHHVSRLTVNKEKIYNNIFTGDSIVLSNQELELIINSLNKNRGLRWSKEQFPNRELIEFSDMTEYLSEDADNTVVIMNEPIYFREGQYAVLFFSNLCCGKRIGGYVEFAFYKKKENGWVKYIEISGGDF